MDDDAPVIMAVLDRADMRGRLCGGETGCGRRAKREGVNDPRAMVAGAVAAAAAAVAAVVGSGVVMKAMADGRGAGRADVEDGGAGRCGAERWNV